MTVNVVASAPIIEVRAVPSKSGPPIFAGDSVTPMRECRSCLLQAAALVALMVPCGLAQTLVPPSGPDGRVHLFNSDLAIFEAGEPRTDLPCDVTPDKPVLGFDLRFHAGYEVMIPLTAFAGSDDSLTILFRVSSDGPNSRPIYLTQHYKVPFVEPDAKGEATLQGAFDLGPGNYHVDWLMRDRAEHVCSFSWDSEAVLGPKEQHLAPSLIPGAVEPASSEDFHEDPPIRREPEAQLRVRILLNFAPQNALSAIVRPVDTGAMISILRGLSHDPRIARFSLVAFNMQEQKVIYQQDDSSRIDFPALGRALQSIHLGTVAVNQLAAKHSDTDFLASLLQQQVAPGPQTPDAMIIAGPKVMLDADVPASTLKAAATAGFPIFYLNYNRDPQSIPWRDTISKAVRSLRGSEYTITEPRDLYTAVNDIVSRVVKSRNERSASSISTR